MTLQICKTIVRAVTALIPKKMTRKRVRTALLRHLQMRDIRGKLRSIRRRQAETLSLCKKKIAAGEKIKVAFLVCDASTFSAEAVFNKMRAIPVYDCFIAVVPRLTRGEDFKNETLEKTRLELEKKYGRAVSLFYDTRTDTAQTLEGRADIIFSSIIYEDQTCGDFTVEAMSGYALVALISYGYSGLFKTNAEQTIFLPNIVFAWKFFLSNRETMEMWTRKNPLLKENAALSGYTKMDRLSDFKPDHDGAAKKIIIAPHHTLTKETDGLVLSNFIRFADFFLSLPKRYPDIKFVFRPHPLLFPRLATDLWWGEERTSRYREQMRAYPNVEFQQGGDYFETFADSSAMIHDCGSFLAEYFYTGRPQCYLMDKGTEEQFLPFGKRLLDHVYRAGTESEILSFIDHTVLNGRDPMKTARDQFARQRVCISYPHATDAVIGTISKELALYKEAPNG